MKRLKLHARWLLPLQLICLCGLLVAQEAEKPEEPATARRPLKISDAKDWKRVNQFTVSPDGTWCGHNIQPNEGDGKITLAQIAGDKKHEFTVGPGSGQISFSHDAKFAAFIEAPDDKTAKASKKTKKPLKNKAVLIELETGTKTEFENARNFAFSGENPKCLAVHKMKPKGRPTGDEGWEGTDLLIYDLAAKTQINIGNVRSFQFNKPGQYLAMTIDAENKTGNGIQLFVIDQSKIVPLDGDSAGYKSLVWTKEGDALAVLKETKDKNFETPFHELVAFWGVGTSEQKQISIDAKKVSSIPDEMTISPNKTPQWNDQRTAILFGIHKLEKKEKDADNKDKESDDDADAQEKTAPKSKGDDEEQADLVIWHWQDKRLQSMQQKQESRDKRKFDLCIHHVKDNNTIRLGDEEIPNVSAGKPFNFAVGTDDRKYRLSGNLDGRRFQDIYVIDLNSGKRKLALEQLRYFFGASPTSDYFLFFQDRHFHVYHMGTGTTTNITEKAQTSFVDDERDVNVTDPPRRVIGWTADGKHVLLNDGWDIWRVPVDGGKSTNLTANGKKEQIRYQTRYRLDPDEVGIDTSKPIYVSAYGEWTKKAGIGRISPNKPGVELLLWDDASFRSLSKVKDQDVYMYSRSTHSQPSNYFVAGPDLNDAKQMTDSNPQQKDFEWSSGVQIIDYKSDHGDKLQAALFLPANHIEGKKYPTIVYIYEKLSQRANNYDSPRFGGFSAAIYTSNGYAVLMPDIVYKINDPGLSAKACVLPALAAAVGTGVVDPQRVGLHGHSWGGYQTAFLITQSDDFAAAVAGAPLTNLISMYSSVYWNSGSANQPIFESSQGRFSGGYWTNLEAYMRNSPVLYAEKVNTPLLLLHNDQDGAVDWNQGIEYFNTLRRLDQPVVMLQYVGENHGLRKDPNRKDYSYRMMAFFDHLLKQKDAPKWWSEGIQHLDMKKHIKSHQKANKGE